MNCDELCERFNLSLPVLNELAAEGLLGEERVSVSEMVFEAVDLENISRILTLKNAGIDVSVIRDLLLMEKAGEGSVSDRLRILTDQREKQMTHIHKEQKKVDRLDYLIHELKGARV